MNNKSYKFESFLSCLEYLTPELKDLIKNLSYEKIENLQEIKLRLGCDILLKFNNEHFFLKELFNKQQIISEKILNDIFQKMCNYSFHCKEKEIENGYISLNNGCRVGIGADYYTDTNNLIKGINRIFSLNIRIAGFYDYDSKNLCNTLFEKNLCGVLIAGAPSSGKTTILRSIGFELSKQYCGVCFIDERKELIIDDYNYLNKNIDIIRGIKKEKAMEIALRVLSPQIIICDEIGTVAESEIIINALNGGAHCIASAHGNDINTILKRPQIKLLIESYAFSKVIFLNEKEIGKIKNIVILNNL